MHIIKYSSRAAAFGQAIEFALQQTFLMTQMVG